MGSKDWFCLGTLPDWVHFTNSRLAALLASFTFLLYLGRSCFFYWFHHGIKERKRMATHTVITVICFGQSWYYDKIRHCDFYPKLRPGPLSWSSLHIITHYCLFSHGQILLMSQSCVLVFYLTSTRLLNVLLLNVFYACTCRNI